MFTIRLWVLLCGVVIAGLVSTSLLFGLVSDHYARKAISSLALRYIVELDSHVQTHAQAYLGEAAQTLDTYAFAMSVDDVSSNSTEFHRRFLFEQMSFLPAYYDLVYFGATDNQLWGMTGPTNVGGMTFYSRHIPDLAPSNSPNCSLGIYENLPNIPSGDGYKANWTCGWSGYNATGRPWYLLMSADPKLYTHRHRKVWTDSYIYIGSHQDGVAGYTIVRAAWRNDTFLGVCAVDVTAKIMSVFLATLRGLTPRTLLFLMDHTGMMVASSNALLPLATKDAAGIDHPMYASQYPEPRVGEIHSIFGNEQTKGVVVATLGGQKHFVVVKQVDAPGQERMFWRTVIAVPESDFMSVVNEGRLTVTYAMIAVSVGVLIISIAVTYYIYSPIKTLREDMAAVADMDLERVSAGTSHLAITEIASMRESFTLMVSNVVFYRAFIPPAVLANSYGEDEDEPDTPKIPTPRGPVVGPEVPASPKIVGVSSRLIVVMTVSYDPTRMNDAQLLLETVSKVSKSLKGLLHSYCNGQIIVTWTRTRHVSRPHVNAVRAAVALTQPSLSTSLTASLTELEMAAHIGIDASSCTTGSVGSSGVLMFNELRGVAVEGSAAMALLGRVFGASMLISEPVAKMCEHACHMRFLGHSPVQDLYAFSADQGFVACKDFPKVYQVMDLRASEKGEASADEVQVLAMEDEEKAAELSPKFDAATRHFADKEYGAAKALFLEVAKQRANDTVSRRFVAFCEVAMGEAPTLTRTPSSVTRTPSSVTRTPSSVKSTRPLPPPNKHNKNK